MGKVHMVRSLRGDSWGFCEIITMCKQMFYYQGMVKSGALKFTNVPSGVTCKNCLSRLNRKGK